MDQLFNRTFDVLSSFLGYRSERHKVVLSNLVNIDTPGYLPKDLVFRKELDDARQGATELTVTHKNHIRPKSPAGKLDLEMVDSGDRVNLDEEMMNLAENQLMYNMTVELLARKFKNLRGAIQEVK